MKNKISRTFAISGSMVDAGNKIRPFELMKCLEFVAGEHACIMGMGIPKVVAEDSAYWVISKMAIDFLDDRPSFGEKIKIIAEGSKKNIEKVVNNKISERVKLLDVAILREKYICVD